MQKLRNKIEQIPAKIDVFDEKHEIESELQRLKLLKKIFNTILNGLKKSFMTYKSNNNRKGNHKKKSISWEKALLPRKRNETHLKKDSTARNNVRAAGKGILCRNCTVVVLNRIKETVCYTLTQQS